MTAIARVKDEIKQIRFALERIERDLQQIEGSPSKNSTFSDILDECQTRKMKSVLIHAVKNHVVGNSDIDFGKLSLQPAVEFLLHLSIEDWEAMPNCGRKTADQIRTLLQKYEKAAETPPRKR